MNLPLASPASLSNGCSVARIAWALVSLVALLSTLDGCAVRTHQLTPTPQLVNKVGLPVYPNATPLMAQQANQLSRLGSANSLSVMFKTTDDPRKVDAFYAKRVPKDARKMVIPMGVMTTTAYQWYVKNAQKQVLFEQIKGTTIIQLESTQLTFGQPSPTPS